MSHTKKNYETRLKEPDTCLFSRSNYWVLSFFTKFEIDSDNDDLRRKKLSCPVLSLLLTHIFLSPIKTFEERSTHCKTCFSTGLSVAGQNVSCKLCRRRQKKQLVRKLANNIGRNFKGGQLVTFFCCWSAGFYVVTWKV